MYMVFLKVVHDVTDCSLRWYMVVQTLLRWYTGLLKVVHYGIDCCLKW